MLTIFARGCLLQDAFEAGQQKILVHWVTSLIVACIYENVIYLKTIKLCCSIAHGDKQYFLIIILVLLTLIFYFSALISRLPFAISSFNVFTDDCFFLASTLLQFQCIKHFCVLQHTFYSAFNFCYIHCYSYPFSFASSAFFLAACSYRFVDGHQYSNKQFLFELLVAR